MNNTLLKNNLEALALRNRGLADRLAHSISDTSYAGICISKNGCPVPIAADGTSYNSLYDPLKEARQLIKSIKSDTFIIFAGIGGAFHVREYLTQFPESACAIAESSIPAFRSLLEIIDISDILSNKHVTIIPDCTDNSIFINLPGMYIPALHGDFFLLPLRAWENRNQQAFSSFTIQIKQAIEKISADYSVQAHFGKVWLRNCIMNLKMAETCQGNIPVFDYNKTAIIAGAGPSLEDHLDELKNERERYVIITTDTAFSTLSDSGIIPDVFVSIDGQSISCDHVRHSLPCTMTVVLDVCGNNAIARRAITSGVNLIFADGGHPLATYASAFSPLPSIDTSSGTVTLAAYDIAHSLGLKDIRIIGADFAYTFGKPYARGTYLSPLFNNSSNRFSSSESLYCSLMFRTPVTRIETSGGLTYTTATLERYAVEAKTIRGTTRWTHDSFHPFPFDVFFSQYQESLQNLLTNPKRNDPVLFTILPFFAWNTRLKAGRTSQKVFNNTIQLALDLIAGYTVLL